MKDDLELLISVYQDFVYQDHHKDRDCHFYINQVWSYGGRAHFRVEHYGYLNELPKKLNDAKFEKYVDARKALVDWLEEVTLPSAWQWQWDPDW